MQGSQFGEGAEGILKFKDDIVHGCSETLPARTVVSYQAPSPLFLESLGGSVLGSHLPQGSGLRAQSPKTNWGSLRVGMQVGRLTCLSPEGSRAIVGWGIAGHESGRFPYTVPLFIF